MRGFERCAPSHVESEGSREQKIEVDGEALEHFKRRHVPRRYRILPGDKVTLELSPCDLNRGRIVYRSRDGH